MKKTIKRYSKIFFISLVLIALSSFFQMCIYFIKGKIIDSATDRNIFGIKLFIGEFIILILLKTLTHYFYSLEYNRFKIKCMESLREKIIYKTLSLSYPTYVCQERGEYQSLYTKKPDSIENEFFDSIFGLNQIIMEMVFGILIILFINIKISIITCLLLTSVIFIPILFNSKLKNNQDQYLRSYSKSLDLFNNYFQGLEVIKNYGFANESFKKLSESINKLRKSALKKSKTVIISKCLVILLSNITLIAILILSSFEIINGKMSVGNFYVLIGIVNQLQSQVIYIAVYSQNIYSSHVAWESIDNYIVSETDDASPAYLIDKVTDIQFKNVKFKFKNEWVINDLNSIFTEGVWLIEGESGTGKSTAMNLLLNYYPMNGGKITINDKDVNTINNLNKIIYIARQEAEFLKFSLRENITLFRDIGDEKIFTVFKEFGLDKYTSGEDLKKTMFTEINFSGGELKRLSLVRAFLSDSQIIILDEPFENIDNPNVELIKNRIFNTEDKILIVISHLTSEEDRKRYKGILNTGGIQNVAE